MPKLIPREKIIKIRNLRSHGWSLPEIYREVRVGYGSVSRYIKDVKILPKYQKIWINKRNGSRARKIRIEAQLTQKAKEDLAYLNSKEKLIFLSALYWGEGGKKDFNFINSDPEMIKVFIDGLRNILKIKQEDIRASIRIYEDLERNTCLKYWSKVTGIPIEDFVNIDVLKGRKAGKLKYGLCRIRVRKGGNVLKYLLAVNRRVSRIFSMSS